MRPLDLTPAGLLGSIAVLLVVVGCIYLGFWQLDRHAQRAERNSAIAERMHAKPVVLNGLPRDTAGLIYRRATARGTLDGARTVVLAGRSLRGTPGVHLLAPLRLGAGALLVNRGWMPAPDAATVDPETVALEGEVRVEGILLPFPDVEVERTGRDAATGFQRTWYRLAGDAIRAQYPYPVPALYLQATTRPEPAGTADSARSLPVILEPPSPDPGPHLSYAFQWFSFAGIFLIGWVILLVRSRHRDDEPRPGPGRPGG